MTTDLVIAELLASRLCHDLAGPLGAVGNGLELLRQEDAAELDGAADLAARSLDQVVGLLQFYRIAYGRVSVSSLQAEQLRALALAVFDGDRLQLNWPEDMPIEGPEHYGKLLLNLVAVGAEALPRGGTVSLVGSRPASSPLSYRVIADGPGAGLKDDLHAALTGQLADESLSPRNVHGAYTRRLAARAGLRLELQAETGRLALLAVPTAGA